ncbi:hypothetical protein ACFWUZ_30510 [Streptomyces sp. NPDC058646]|uniref:hypothetical protein n=1 Tax=Streptomyces sp. NPDC058646 TaxID=3346574 RepID=UPI00365884D8
MVLLLLLLLPAGFVAALVFAGCGLSGLRHSGRAARLRSLAALLAAVAAALYTWGLLHVAGAVVAAEDGGAGSSPLPPCRTPGQWERAQHVIDYSVDYVPLRFVCETTGGGAYAAEAVPVHVNPAVLVLALASAGCAGAAALGTRRRDTSGAA